ncbi:Cilia- and flagella-associated protein 161 [Geodia barretti]|uniref:Cilia- and flagella-associated protein 161 n=1 Tax=Geodia barretti TaxID=519541 RepID=A0AA35RRM4_GEOBA|nr:Cilia- and flagella-associated protein 161 [Geodia barretti]
MSVRTYNPSVRVGNWNEDLCLEEEQLKDFLEKKDRGELTVQKKTNFLKTILRNVELSKPSDGYLHIGDRVCLLHTPTKTVVSAHVTSARAFDATRLESGCGYGESEAKEGEVVCYGQPVALVTLPDEGGQLGLHSDRATFTKHSRFSREQEVLLEEDISYNSAWKFICFSQDERLETEGTPVPVSRLERGLHYTHGVRTYAPFLSTAVYIHTLQRPIPRVFLNHCKTNHNLAVHEEWTYKTPFGRELEVTGHTHLNTHKAEDVHNHFMVVTGSLEDAVASLSPSS